MLKIFQTIRDILLKVEMIHEHLKKEKKENPKWTVLLVDVNRHQIGSINLQDIVDSETLTGDERKNYLMNAELLWKNPVFQSETKLIIRKQLEFIGMESSDFEKVLVGRGTINGSDLLRERIEKLHVEYSDPEKKKGVENFDKFEVSA